MKKTALILILLSVLLPQITYAAWWNPLTWFNNWKFKAVEEIEIKDNKSEIIHPVTESVSSGTGISEEKSSDLKKDSPSINTKNISSPTPVSEVNQVKLQNDFRAECNLNKSEAAPGDLVRAKLKLYFQQSKDFNVTWPKENLEKFFDWDDVLFRVDDYGHFDFSPIVTRISDGYSKKILCFVEVPCDQYECLGPEEKKVYKIKQIIDEVSSWGNGDYPYLTIVDKCNISESVIRAYEYEYSLFGGAMPPTFSKSLDCASSLSVAAYEYKLKLFLDTISD